MVWPSWKECFAWAWRTGFFVRLCVGASSAAACPATTFYALLHSYVLYHRTRPMWRERHHHSRVGGNVIILLERFVKSNSWSITGRKIFFTSVLGSLHQYSYGSERTPGLLIIENLRCWIWDNLFCKEEFYGKKLILADRDMVETESDEILRDADTQDISLLVVGDPFGYAFIL